MEKTRMIFVRHGQSIGNLEQRFLGNTNLDLSPLGYRQAELTCSRLIEYPIDVFVSSDLKRAYNTVLPAAKKMNQQVITNINLREIHAGLWEGEKFDDLPKKYPQNYAVWKNDIGSCVTDGGESVMQVQQRIKSELEIIAKAYFGKTVCIGIHALPLRVMSCVWRGLDISSAKDIGWVPNASITQVDYNYDGSYDIITYGDDSHLGDISTFFSSNV